MSALIVTTMSRTSNRNTPDSISPASAPSDAVRLVRVSVAGSPATPLRDYEEAYLSIHTQDVRRRIERGAPSWEAMVLSYERTSWGNHGAPVMPADVVARR